MYTISDLYEVLDDEQRLMNFVRDVINQHKYSDMYKIAEVADLYAKHQNKTIMDYQRLLYTVSGSVVPDEWSPNHKMASGFFNRFITQETQYLLANGVTWKQEGTAARLGEDFDTKLQTAGKEALIGGVSFGFWNYDHLEVFDILEFAPLYDEENGSLSAGIRFWQIDNNKPLRATLYMLDGYTEYIWRKGKGEIMVPKRAYQQIVAYSDAEGTEIYDGDNYPTFPIIPLWGNPYHQSELVGIREQIDCYDLIKSEFANTIDEASFVYWVIENAGGMDDMDLAKFVERIKTMHAATMEDNGAHAEAHTLEAPHESRDALLDRLRRDLYEDYMALDTKEIAGGITTATQIRAAYEDMDIKANDFEYCVCEFLKGLLAVIGIDDKPTFTRSRLVNTQEEIQTLLSADSALDSEYITRKVLDLLGDGDQAEEVLKRKAEEDEERFRQREEMFNSERKEENDEWNQ